MSHINCLKYCLITGICYSQGSLPSNGCIGKSPCIHSWKQFFLSTSKSSKSCTSFQIGIHMIQNQTVACKKNFPMRNTPQCIAGLKSQLNIFKTNAIPLQLYGASGTYGARWSTALNHSIFRNHYGAHSFITFYRFPDSNLICNNNKTFPLLKGIHEVLTCSNSGSIIPRQPNIPAAPCLLFLHLRLD